MKKITVYVSDEMHAELKAMSGIDERPITYVAFKLIQQAIKERNRKKKLPLPGAKDDNS